MRVAYYSKKARFGGAQFMSMQLHIFESTFEALAFFTE
jgi:hypothetical protein